MPVAHDPVSRIINVHWGGKAVFVIGTRNGSVYYAAPQDQDNFGLVKSSFPESGLFPEWHFFTVSGSAFGMINATETNKGTPVFLVCGLSSELTGYPPGNPSYQSYSFICKSGNGRTWSRVYKGPQGTEVDSDGVKFPWNSYSHALVWMPTDKKFYHSMALEKTTDDVQWSHEQIFSSSDGSSFSQISDRSTLPADNTGLFQSQFPANYCGHNRGFDARGQHVPDGVMSTFNANKDTAMRPKKPPVSSYAGLFGNNYLPLEWSKEVEIVTLNTAGEEEIQTVSVPNIDHVTCVAGKGGAWMAGGWNDGGDVGAIAVSFDSGETWKPGPAVDSGVTTIAWADPEDVGA